MRRFRAQSKLISGLEPGRLPLRLVLLCAPWPPQLSFHSALTLHPLVRPTALLRTPNWCFHHLLRNTASNKQPESLWWSVTPSLTLSISRRDQRLWWMHWEYDWLISPVKLSNTSWIFKEIKNWIVPSVCACYFCLYRQKLFIPTNQEIQASKYNHGKRSKRTKVGSCRPCPIILESIAKLFGVRKAMRQNLYRRNYKTGSKAGCRRQGTCFNCVQTTWVSRREPLDYHMENFQLPK